MGLEFIYLARLGLRAADDPRLRSSLTVADGMLRVVTPSGAGYHRYRGDAYGEHADGTPFNGTGIGRVWPLLTGERGIMALLQGEDPLPYLETMLAMAGRAGLLPEQVWDGDAIPAHELEPGKPTGSAMPLVWAHAEFLKLLAAREQGRPLERLDAVWQRYRGHQPTARTCFWREQVPFETLPAERSLVIESDEPFRLHFGFDGWGRVADRAASPLGLGMRGVRIDAAQLVGAQELNFTRFFTRTERWERADHTIELTRGGSDRES